MSPTSSPPSTRPPASPHQHGHRVVEPARPVAVGVDQVARHLGPRPDGQTQRTHLGAPHQRRHPSGHLGRGDPDVVGHQDPPGAHGGGAAPGVGLRRAAVGEQPAGGRPEGQAAQLGQGPGPAAGKGSVEEARHPHVLAQPAGEPVALGHRRREVPGRRAAGLVGDEGHHVEHAEAGVGTAVPAQVEVGQGGGGQGPGGFGHQVSGAGEGEDGPVVVGVTVLVEQRGAGRRGQPAQQRLVPALADVDHALDEHGASVARPPVSRAQARRRSRRAEGPPGQGLLGDDGVRVAAAAQNAPALTLGGATPDPVVDVVLERVLEAGLGDGALGADALGDQHAHAVIGEEDIGCNFFALPPGHPVGRHCSAPFSRIILREHPVQSQVIRIGSS